jgi:hypothetical protein
MAKYRRNINMWRNSWPAASYRRVGSASWRSVVALKKSILWRVRIKTWLHGANLRKKRHGIGALA